MGPGPRSAQPGAGKGAVPGAGGPGGAMLETQEFHFLLLPEFSVMGFASAVEALQTESANPQGMLLHTENTAQ